VMKTVGETLRTAREKKGYDIDYVSDTLKIRAKYLQALEEGDYSIFPSPLYIKGFLKNYAKLLGIDESEILALYRREYTYDPKEKEREFLPIDNPVKTVKFVLKPGYIVTFFTAMVILLIVIYLIYEYKTFSTPPTLAVNSPSQNQVVNTQTITVNGNTGSSGNKVAINGVQVPFVSDNGDFSINVALHSGLNELIITSTNSLNRVTTLDRDVIFDDASLNISGTPTPPQVANGTTVMNGRLVIEHDSTWVKISADNKIVFEGVVEPGIIKTFQAQMILVIDTGRPDDTQLSVNGQNVTLQGSGIVEKTITINQSGTLAVQ